MYETHDKEHTTLYPHVGLPEVVCRLGSEESPAQPGIVDGRFFVFGILVIMQQVVPRDEERLQ